MNAIVKPTKPTKLHTLVRGSNLGSGLETQRTELKTTRKEIVKLQAQAQAKPNKKEKIDAEVAKMQKEYKQKLATYDAQHAQAQIEAKQKYQVGLHSVTDSLQMSEEQIELLHKNGKTVHYQNREEAQKHMDKLNGEIARLEKENPTANAEAIQKAKAKLVRHQGTYKFFDEIVKKQAPCTDSTVASTLSDTVQQVAKQAKEKGEKTKSWFFDKEKAGTFWGATGRIALTAGAAYVAYKLFNWMFGSSEDKRRAYEAERSAQIQAILASANREG